MLSVHPQDRPDPLHRLLHLREHLLLGQVSVPLFTHPLVTMETNNRDSFLQHFVSDGAEEAAEEDVRQNQSGRNGGHDRELVSSPSPVLEP